MREGKCINAVCMYTCKFMYVLILFVCTCVKACVWMLFACMSVNVCVSAFRMAMREGVCVMLFERICMSAGPTCVCVKLFACVRVTVFTYMCIVYMHIIYIYRNTWNAVWKKHLRLYSHKHAYKTDNILTKRDNILTNMHAKQTIFSDTCVWTLLRGELRQEPTT